MVEPGTDFCLFEHLFSKSYLSVDGEEMPEIREIQVCSTGFTETSPDHIIVKMDFEGLHRTVNKCLEASANEQNSVLKAISTAMHKAKAEAECLAEAAGAKLGVLLHVTYNIDEEDCSMNRQEIASPMASDACCSMPEAPVLESDELSIDATATACWEIE